MNERSFQGENMLIDIKDICTFNVFGNSYQLPLDESEADTRERILLTATIFFASKGYAAVSMRDIAKILKMQPSSLYNHYKSKEALWTEVLTHANNLYMLYFTHLATELDAASSFEDVVRIIFHEPKLMTNTFTCYAFCLIQCEQFRDELAGKIYRETFLKYSIDFFRERFDQCIARGWVKPFDTNAVATLIMHTSLIGLQNTLQQRMGHATAYDTAAMFDETERFILAAAGPAPTPTRRKPVFT